MLLMLVEKEQRAAFHTQTHTHLIIEHYREHTVYISVVVVGLPLPVALLKLLQSHTHTLAL